MNNPMTNNPIQSEKEKIVFDELKMNKINLLERFLLLFVPTKISVDYGFGNDTNCTIFWKKLFGKLYIVKQLINKPN